jgi:hypothetical protein
MTSFFCKICQCMCLNICLLYMVFNSTCRHVSFSMLVLVWLCQCIMVLCCSKTIEPLCLHCKRIILWILTAPGCFELASTYSLCTSKVCVALFCYVLCRWDCSFQYGSLVEEVDGHTALLYHRLQLDWFPM